MYFQDDLSETPLTVLFLQLETVANSYLDSRRKARRAKRQKTCEGDCTTSDTPIDLKDLLENKANNMECASSITSEDLINILKDNIKEYTKAGRAFEEDDVDGVTTNLCLTKAVIDAFSQSNVIDLVKQNLLARLS